MVKTHTLATICETTDNLPSLIFVLNENYQPGSPKTNLCFDPVCGTTAVLSKGFKNLDKSFQEKPPSLFSSHQAFKRHKLTVHRTHSKPCIPEVILPVS